MSLVVDETHLGTSESEWLGSGLLDAVPAVQLPAATDVVVVAPHPDDEVMGAGGLLGRLAGAGARVHLLAVTDGDGSHPSSPTVTPGALAAIRVAETAAGLRRLSVAPTTTVRLRIPDGWVGDHEDLVAAALADLLGRTGPTTTVLAPWALDGHRDHDACGRAARTATSETGVPLLEYLVWAWHWASPAGGQIPLDGAVRVGLTRRQTAAKRWATCAYRSQIRPLGDASGDEVVLPAAVLRRAWRPFEILLPRRAPQASGGGRG